MPHPIYDVPLRTLSGEETDLSAHRGKVLLIVNTASKCGLTPQLEGLERLSKDFGARGLVVLGFPCNQFAHQEPGTSDQIGEFCQRNYGVTFPMFEKIDVNGRDTHDLYRYLKKEAKGLLGSEAIKWNFTKFLVDRNGNVVRRYAPKTSPSALREDIEAALGGRLSVAGAQAMG